MTSSASVRPSHAMAICCCGWPTHPATSRIAWWRGLIDRRVGCATLPIRCGVGPPRDRALSEKELAVDGFEPCAVERSASPARSLPALRGPSHDTHSRIRGRRCGRVAFRCPDSPTRPAQSSVPHNFFFPTLSAVSASMRWSLRTRRMDSPLRRLRCPWWMGLEDGLRRLRGGDRSVPAEVRPRHARADSICRRHAADAGQDRGASPHPHAPVRGEPGAPAILAADRPSALRQAPPPRSHRPMSCWSPRPAPDCSPSSRSCDGRIAGVPDSAELRAALVRSLYARQGWQHATTLRISTIISTPASRRASCS